MSCCGMVFYIKKLRVDYFTIMLYHNKVSGDSQTDCTGSQSAMRRYYQYVKTIIHLR